MKDEVLQVIATECDLDEVPALSDSLSDIAVTSIGLICIVDALEARFDIEIPFDGNVTDVVTAGDIVALVEQLVAIEDPDQGWTRE